jgi:hypothetical protein
VQADTAAQQPAVPAPSRAQVEEELGRGLAIAHSQGRDDLAARLESAHAALVARDHSVVVTGEFKQGKSSLVNALVKSEVCAVDDDVVTAVPTIVCFGERPEALVHHAAVPDPAGGGDRPVRWIVPPARPIPLDQVGRYVRGEVGTGDDGEPGPETRSVEVRLDRRVLRAGLSFVDCPGVGGLESAEGTVTLGALGLAEALLFVTDAAQELTRPELTFIQAALQRGPRVACVVTKIDLYAEWRRIVELDQAHLARAGLDVPVIPVSSFLRLRAAASDDAAMNDESRFPGLFDFLQAEVVAGADAARIERAADEVVFATRQLRRGLEAESDVMARPEDGAQVVQRLAQAAAATDALRAGGASWQRVLSDGIQDLVDDVRHDLRDRLRTVLQSGEQVIDRSDPKDSWAEFETWVRRQVVGAAVATYDHLISRATELTERVGRQFSQDAHTPIALSISAPVAALEQIPLTGDFALPAGARANVVLSAARGSYGGMAMLGMAGGLIGVPLAAPVALLLSLGLGRKSVHDELVRRHQVRQNQAKAALRQYVDKVSFLVDHECADALRRTQRALRDEFMSRARSLHQSSSDALAQAQQVLALDQAHRDRRRTEVQHELASLGSLSQRAAFAEGPTQAPAGGSEPRGGER